jgi:hypothetical protein
MIGYLRSRCKEPLRARGTFVEKVCTLLHEIAKIANSRPVFSGGRTSVPGRLSPGWIFNTSPLMRFETGKQLVKRLRSRRPRKSFGTDG